MILYYFKFAVVGFRESKRVEKVVESPVLTSFSETHHGTSTIRAFGK